jgi:hypothetical protein
MAEDDTAEFRRLEAISVLLEIAKDESVDTENRIEAADIVITDDRERLSEDYRRRVETAEEIAEELRDG